MNQNDIRNMADVVAKAIHTTVIGEGDETWADLTDDEQNQFRALAYAAMGAHDGWLTLNGFAIVQKPKKAAVVAPKRQLLGPDGRPVN
jgi:hypothetical protein